MLTRSQKLTKALVSLAFMLLLASALIADQARANLPEDAVNAMTTSVDTFVDRQGGILLDAETLHIISSLPYMLGRANLLPVSVDAGIDLLLPDDDGKAAGRPTLP